MQSDLEHDMPTVSPHYTVKDEVLQIGKEYFPPNAKLSTAISPLYLCWHIVMDITFGLCGMLVLALILPILALLIYLDSPGPIFYKQERLGYQRKKFNIYKFRTMYTNTEEANHVVLASKDDRRVTRIGRFLRVTHLDELPQVYNILRGDMSLIGPRPQPEDYVSELEEANPLYCYRLSIKPGLTGWAQVNYPYTSTVSEGLMKLDYDLYYIEHQSVTLDISIILKTVVEVVLCHGT